MPGKLPPEQRAGSPGRGEIPAQTDGEVSEEGLRIIQWRFEALSRAGYSSDAAVQLSKRFQGPDKIDLHEAIELMQSIRQSGKYKGKEEEQALHILL